MLEEHGEKGENNLLVSRCDVWQVLALLHVLKVNLNQNGFFNILEVLILRFRTCDLVIFVLRKKWVSHTRHIKTCRQLGKFCRILSVSLSSISQAI